jgi:hypothetical protein
MTNDRASVFRNNIWSSGDRDAELTEAGYRPFENIPSCRASIS